MWLVLAFLSAVFASLATILAKPGQKNVDSTLATLIRTAVVLVFSWLLAGVSGCLPQLAELSGKTWLFLVLSGLATGGSWLCYFRAIQLGPVGRVAAVDKTSTVLTVIFAVLIFHESVSLWKFIGTALLLLGAMILTYQKGGSNEKRGLSWLPFAVLSAVFAALTSILVKIGITGADSNLATAIRTVVVLFMSAVMLLVQNKGKIPPMPKKREFLFIVLSGIATGGSWLCFFRALQIGDVSAVVPIDKLSIVFVAVFSGIFLKEKYDAKAILGFAVLTAGTFLMLVP